MPDFAPFPAILNLTLQGEGFLITSWRHNIITGSDLRTFRRETINGLLGYFAPARIGLVAVDNDVPGNGQFVSMMDALEHAAHSLGYAVQVGPMFNHRLSGHLIRERGYSAMADPDYLILEQGAAVRTG